MRLGDAVDVLGADAQLGEAVEHLAAALHAVAPARRRAEAGVDEGDVAVAGDDEAAEVDGEEPVGAADAERRRPDGGVDAGEPALAGARAGPVADLVDGEVADAERAAEPSHRGSPPGAALAGEAGLPLLELDAEGVEDDGDGPVAADQRDQVHELLHGVALGESGVGRV